MVLALGSHRNKWNGFIEAREHAANDKGCNDTPTHVNRYLSEPELSLEIDFAEIIYVELRMRLIGAACHDLPSHFIREY